MNTKLPNTFLRNLEFVHRLAVNRWKKKATKRFITRKAYVLAYYEEEKHKID